MVLVGCGRTVPLAGRAATSRDGTAVPARQASAPGVALPCLVGVSENDQCPTWVSDPYNRPEGVGGRDQLLSGNFGGPRDTVMSPDGSTVYAVATASDGSYQCQVGGSTVTFAGEDIATLAYSTATGNLRWDSLQRAIGNEADVQGLSIAVSPDGSQVFVTGFAGPMCTAGNEITIAYDAATGAKQWMWQWTPSSQTLDSAGAAMAISPDGDQLYVAGSIANPAPGPQATAFVQAFDTRTGELLWTAFDPQREWTAGTAVAVSPDGTRVLTGENVVTIAPGAGVQNLAQVVGTRLLAFDAATGKLDWSSATASIDGTGGLTDLALSPGGSIAYTLACNGNANTLHGAAATGAYATRDGSQVWHASYTDSNQSACPSASGALAISPHGKTLYESGAQAGALFALALDSTDGSTRWLSLVDQSANATADENPANGALVALSPAGGTVYLESQDLLGARCVSCTATSLTTAAIDATTGNQLWTARYGSPEVTNEGAGIDVTPNSGRIIVFGNQTQCADTGPAVGAGWAVIAVAYDPASGAPSLPGPGGQAPDQGLTCAADTAGSNVPVTLAEAPPYLFPLTVLVVMAAAAVFWDRRRRRATT